MKYEVFSKLDKDELKDIWLKCFSKETQRSSDWYFNGRFNEGRIVGYRLNGRIVTNLHLQKYDMQIRGQSVKTEWIVGAATLPEYRNKDLMANLLQDSLQDMKERGITATWLYPFKYSFYKKFGWAISTTAKRYVLDKPSFNGIERASGEVVRLKGSKDAEDYIGDIKECYAGYTGELTGYVLRHDTNWKHLLDGNNELNGLTLLFLDKGKVTGYLIALPDKERLLVEEAVFEEYSVFVSMMDYIWSKGFERASVLMKPNDMFMELMQEARSKVYLEPYAMMRIVDVIHFFEGITPSCDIDIAFELKDVHANWNDGSYRLTAKRGERSSLRRTDESGLQKLDIAALAQIICGSVSASDLQKLGLLDWDNNSVGQMDCAFPRQTSFVFEIF